MTVPPLPPLPPRRSIDVPPRLASLPPGVVALEWRSKYLAEADGGEPADREGILAAGDRFSREGIPLSEGDMKGAKAPDRSDVGPVARRERRGVEPAFRTAVRSGCRE